MNMLIKHKLLNIPLSVWVMQLAYVAAMLGLLLVIAQAMKLSQRPASTKLLVVIPYVVVMIMIDIAWRIAIKRLKPGWF